MLETQAPLDQSLYSQPTRVSLFWTHTAKFSVSPSHRIDDGVPPGAPPRSHLSS